MKLPATQREIVEYFRDSWAVKADTTYFPIYNNKMMIGFVSLNTRRGTWELFGRINGTDICYGEGTLDHLYKQFGITKCRYPMFTLWGNNCRILRMSAAAVEDLVDQYRLIDRLTSDQYDEIMDGYLNGIRGVDAIVSITDYGLFESHLN